MLMLEVNQGRQKEVPSEAEVCPVEMSVRRLHLLAEANSSKSGNEDI